MSLEYKKSKGKLFEVRFIPVTESGCWIWTAGIDKDGYGIFHYRNYPEKAHRVSFMLYKGEIPKGMIVCHKCDVTSCVNPDHLYAGTHQDNANDKVARGRQRNATSEQASKKLTWNDVEEIRKLVSEGAVQRRLAERFGVSYATICRIVNNMRWK